MQDRTSANSMKRTAGPYIGVNRDTFDRGEVAIDVRYPSNSDQPPGARAVTAATRALSCVCASRPCAHAPASPPARRSDFSCKDAPIMAISSKLRVAS